MNRTLTHLDLSENDISDLGTEAICKALQSNNVLTHLILAGNKIGDSGAVALAEALKSPATQLSHLSLVRCRITSLGVEILAGALETNRSLTNLNLSFNQISDTGAIQLAQPLLENKKTWPI